MQNKVFNFHVQNRLASYYEVSGKIQPCYIPTALKQYLLFFGSCYKYEIKFVLCALGLEEVLLS